MAKKSEIKKQYITEQAEKVFREKGYSAVTMSDIVEACEISRGGLYLYFSNVDEVFLGVLKNRDMQLDTTGLDMDGSKSFKQLTEIFFGLQKQKLLGSNRGLLQALFEYYLMHRESDDKNYYIKQFFGTKYLLIKILKYGADKGKIKKKEISNLAHTILFVLSGMETMSLSGSITEDIIENQFAHFKKIISASK
ncbi:MAG TPA: hypothetical protein DEQ02_09625 [Ruminococcaceae bacterium]|nr:hypothetical protein [Oscillospiraceae bacterium]